MSEMLGENAAVIAPAVDRAGVADAGIARPSHALVVAEADCRASQLRRYAAGNKAPDV
jgi:hypothetical protein